MKSANDLLKQNSRLKYLISRAQNLTHLNKVFLSSLAPNLAKHCRIADYRNGELKVYADSATWLTQLRYQQAEVIEKLKNNAEFRAVKHLSISVLPKEAPPQAKPKHVAPLSEGTKHLLQKLASCTEDEKLANALQKLSSR